MEFRILGPLEVVENGQRLELGGGKHRALLAVLLLHANEVVSTDRLIDALWEQQSPDGGRKTLQVYVSQLRKALGKDRLQTQAPGYRLRVDRDELDLERFERLAGSGQIHDALALWRGPPLSEFAYQRFAQADIDRLEELRLACLEKRIAADLAGGRHAALVGELEALVKEHPVRERLREQLMLALYRSGRQAEALAAYQDARRALVEELGIEPGRSLRQLQQSILEQDPALDLEPPSEVATEPPLEPPARPPGPEPTARGERKTVSVLHARVALTSTDVKSLDPEVLRRVLTRAFAEISRAIEAHEGTIEAVTGDSVAGVFGLPVVHEDDAARATRAAEDVRLHLADLARELDPAMRLDVHLGVGTGEVMAGGSPGPRLRATGEPLTRAAQLAAEAEPNDVLLDEATRRAVAARRDVRRFTSPMVGRERERRRLHDAFEQAAGDRSCQLFTILGAAGVGKSRLAQELLGDLADRALVARGRCLPYGEGITFWPVLEAIKDVTGLHDTETPEQASDRLAALVEDEPAAPSVAQRVVEVMGLTEATVNVDDGFQAIRTYLELLATARPLVVVFDDVHWGEETFLDLVEHLADWSRGTPILLLCMARPELLDVRPSWSGGKLNATTVLLEPLSDDECGQLVANLVGEAELAEEVGARIAGAAEGNPLFVEEMLSMLIDDGLLVRESGRWTATGDLTKVPVPPTIQALLAARLDQLGSGERASIEAAAVEGQVFHESSVAQLALGEPAVSSALAALVRKELIRPEPPVFSGERAFRFRHLLIRDAAYESIPKESRATLHEQHVTWLEAKVSERAVEFDEIVGYHLEQAYRYRSELDAVDDATSDIGRRAAELLGAAGRRAFARSDAPAGVNLVSRAVRLLSPDDPLRVELVPNVRVVQGMSDLSWADRVLTEAVEASSTTGDRRLAAHALVQRGLLRLFTEWDVTAHELVQTAEQAIKVFEELGDSMGLARAWRLVAQANYLDGQARACADASERALAHARAAGDRFEEREIVEWLGIALVLGSTPAVEAEERCRHLLPEVSGDAAREVQFLGTLAYLVAIQGRSDEFAELVERAENAVAVREWSWIVPTHFAWVALAHEDPVAAEQALLHDHERLKRLGEKSHFSSITTVLAQAAYAQGRYADAEALVAEAELASRPNDVHSRIVMRSTRAKVLARRGDFEAAERLARDASSYAETTDFLHSRGDALMDLAEVLELAGRPGDSAEVLREAIQVYERKGNLLAADRTRAWLNRLV
jgi:predicted ATPase/DNA-binding SARP family transcriptional activator